MISIRFQLLSMFPIRFSYISLDKRAPPKGLICRGGPPIGHVPPRQINLCGGARLSNKKYEKRMGNIENH